MNKTRLESFSDGVFAIAITILVLNISIGDVSYDQLGSALYALWPRILSFVMSFLLIGLYWIGHHFYFERIKIVDGTFVFLNILLLMLISFMPFSAYLLSRYPLGEIALLVYGATLLLTNVLSFIMLLYIYHHRQLTNEHFKDEFYQVQLPLFIIFNALYVLGMAVAWIWPVLSYGVYILVLLLGIRAYVKRINSSVAH